MDGLVTNAQPDRRCSAAAVPGTDCSSSAGWPDWRRALAAWPPGSGRASAPRTAWSARELDSERHELRRRGRRPSKDELAEMLIRHGLTPQTAQSAAAEIAADPDVALRFHAPRRARDRSRRASLPTDRCRLQLSGVRAGGTCCRCCRSCSVSALCGCRWWWREWSPPPAGPSCRGWTDDRPFRGGLVQLLLVAGAIGITYALGSLIGGAVR